MRNLQSAICKERYEVKRKREEDMDSYTRTQSTRSERVCRIVGEGENCVLLSRRHMGGVGVRESRLRGEGQGAGTKDLDWRCSDGHCVSRGYL
jgi:hypothetical protein